jgi:hypothetical protein
MSANQLSFLVAAIMLHASLTATHPVPQIVGLFAAMTFTLVAVTASKQ